MKTNATASPVVEAAAPVLTSSTATALPAGIGLPSRANRLTAAGRFARTLLERVAAWCREISGAVEILTADQCSECGETCREVTHLETSVGCAGPLFVGFCDVCLGDVVARPDGNRYRCYLSSYHHVVNVRRERAADFHRESFIQWWNHYSRIPDP